MNTCNFCQVSVDASLSICPLCGKTVAEESKETPLSYPNYPINRTNPRLRLKIWLYLTIAIIVSAGVINLLTWRYSQTIWSAIVSVITLYIWFMGKNLYQNFSLNQLAKTLWKNYFFVAIAVFVIDMSTGFSRWSLNYVIPLLGVGTGLSITIRSFIHKSMWRDDIGYFLLTLSITLVPLLLFFFKGITVLWPSLLSFLYGVLTITGLLIFSGKRLWYELQKRFHY